MKTFFSLIYPTRDRPEFVRMALRFLKEQNYDNFEIIISDNYTDQDLSCEEICKNSGLKNIVYVRPNFPVGMVKNWNYPLSFAKGDYISYFTDKMFLLPGILSHVNDLVLSIKPDIITWLADSFMPDSSQYFRSGIYSFVIGREGIADGYTCYDPFAELNKKACANKSRNENNPSEYTKGKICFGAYSKALIKRILLKSDTLFKNISPDYTSMILGLSFADSAIEINKPGIVHIHTDISNGQLCSINDKHSYKFISQLKNLSDIIQNLPVPGLYSSVHNMVAHDYLTMKKLYNLSYNYHHLNWLVYIYEDFDIVGRKWSSTDVEDQQKALYQNYLNNNLDKLSQEYVYSRIALRKKINKNSIKKNIKNLLSKVLPKKLILLIKRILYGRRHVHLSKLDIILTKQA